MVFDFWTILLIVSTSQCIFLLAYFLAFPSSNQAARSILVMLLLAVLAINVSNIISASYLYRLYPEYAGFARGMVLLLGPLLYLYMNALIKPNFKLKGFHLMHSIPYLVAFVIIRIQEGAVSEEVFIAAVDAVMEGKIKMNMTANLWFISYFIHLSIYLGLSYALLRNSIQSSTAQYLIPVEQRVIWLKNVIIQFVIITLLFLGISIYCFLTGVYTIVGNFLYTLMLAVIVYLIAYQAIRDRRVLTPGFINRYRNLNPGKEREDLILDRLVHLFEEDKIFVDPGLKVATLAELLDCTPHLLSQIINAKLNKNFSELLQLYRINEFKIRAAKDEYQQYTIMGIAYDVGYNSKSTFNTHFKKHTGITPSEYLKSIRG
jgi:AraC-like DNA-binding protein